MYKRQIIYGVVASGASLRHLLLFASRFAAMSFARETLCHLWERVLEGVGGGGGRLGAIANKEIGIVAANGCLFCEKAVGMKYCCFRRKIANGVPNGMRFLGT